MANLGPGGQWQPPPRWQQPPTQWQQQPTQQQAPPPQQASPPQWRPPPPANPAAAEKAYLWFKAYVGVMVAIYLFCLGVGAVFLLAPFGGTPEDVTGQRITGAIYAFIGLSCLGLYGVGLFLPRRPWGWVYGIVLISLGMTSCLVIPAAIPLLIFWLKPEMKARFNMS